MMKIIGKKIFIFFTLTSVSVCLLFFSFIFLKSIEATQADQDNGRVLGASENFSADGKETAASGSIEYFGNFLPENKYRQLGPRKLFSNAELAVEARAGAVIDCRDHVKLYEQAADEQLPIASITKLMTALVFLEHNPGWENIYTIAKNDRIEGGKIYVYYGERVKIEDLFYLSLVSSGNTETMALVNSTGLTEAEFVEQMNKKAKEMRLTNTNFVEPVGISSYNLSTAGDVATLAEIALSDVFIRKATMTKKYEFKTLAGRKVIAETTDGFVSGDQELNDLASSIRILGGKTGYTEAAGYCFVGWFSNDDGREIITVVLGAKSDAQRFFQTKKAVAWVYANYSWN